MSVLLLPVVFDLLASAVPSFILSSLHTPPCTYSIYTQPPFFNRVRECGNDNDCDYGDRSPLRRPLQLHSIVIDITSFVYIVSSFVYIPWWGCSLLSVCIGRPVKSIHGNNPLRTSSPTIYTSVRSQAQGRDRPRYHNSDHFFTTSGVR